MSPAGRAIPPIHVWLSLLVGLYMLGRAVQDVASGLITGMTWFRFAAAAYLAHIAIRDLRKFQRRQRQSARSAQHEEPPAPPPDEKLL